MVRPVDKKSKTPSKPGNTSKGLKSSIQAIRKKSTASKAPAPKQSKASKDKEYASEINKITQILGGMNTPNRLSITTESDHSIPEAHASTTEIDDSANIGRPLTGGELKQLLSSITRVISLHKLPASNAPSQSNLGDRLKEAPVDPKKGVGVSVGTTDSLHKSKTKSKMSQKVPKDIKNPAITVSVREQARLGSRPIGKPRKPNRKSKSRDKSVERVETVEKKGSASSIEEDPVVQAKFLRKYHEETVNLANRLSSGVIEGEPEQEEIVSKRNRRKTSKADTTGAKLASKSTVKGNTGQSGKQLTRNQKSKTPLPSRKSSASTGRNRTRKPSASAERTLNVQNHPSVYSNHNESDQRQADVKTGNSIPSEMSAMNAIISQFQRHPMLATYDELESTKHFLLNLDPRLNGPVSGTPSTQFTAPSTPSISGLRDDSFKMDDVNANFPRQPQFANFEEMLADKLPHKTPNMQSIWEKTPYEPMSNSHFREMLNKYANSTDKLAFSLAEMEVEPKKPKSRSTSASGSIFPMTSSLIPQTSSLGIAPGRWDFFYTPTVSYQKV